MEGFYYVFLGSIFVVCRTLERQRHKHYWLQTQQDGREGKHLNICPAARAGFSPYLKKTPKTLNAYKSPKRLCA